MTRRAVVLFARTPEGEALAKRLPAGAAVLFERFIASWLRASAAVAATAIVACDSDAERRLSLIEPSIARTYITQGNGTFGQRLARVADATSHAGFDTIVIAAIDAAAPPDLHRAFRVLEAQRVRSVIGPAHDGGINFIGFTEPPLALLRSLTPRDRHTIERCERYFGRVYRFAVVADIDSVHDLAPVAFAPVAASLVPREVPQRFISRAPPAA